MKKITKAILPVAGFGTRFLPATKAQPKEMLPIVDKPVIQYLVEEAVAAGIEEIIFVTGRGKRAIEDHFDVSYELEDTLVEKNKLDLLETIKGLPTLAKFAYVRQSSPLGDGHAILQAAHLLNPDDAVLVIFGDCLYDSQVPGSKQLIDAYYRNQTPIVGLTEVERSEVSKFGVIDGTRLDEQTFDVTRFVEKPKAEDAPSNFVAPGKYIIDNSIFEILRKMDHGKSGEIRLADAFDELLAQGGKLHGHLLEGTWLDTGDKFNFLKTTIHMALRHPELGSKFRDYIRTLQA